MQIMVPAPAKKKALFSTNGIPSSPLHIPKKSIRVSLLAFKKIMKNMYLSGHYLKAFLKINQNGQFEGLFSENFNPPKYNINPSILFCQGHKYPQGDVYWVGFHLDAKTKVT